MRREVLGRTGNDAPGDARAPPELRHLPATFSWGAATAAFQVEGAVREDGRGASIWDTYSDIPGAIAGGDRADVGPDHYHRWAEDVALMGSLRRDSYRLSVAWPRIVPDGIGKVEPRGLDFYDRLVDSLLEAGIRPWVTLYHWDLPQPLQDLGGWADRRTVSAFVEYTDAVVRRLGDRVATWLTLNEPWVVALVHNWYGSGAPGIRELPTSLGVAHGLLLGHGRAAQAIRAVQPRARIGIALSLSPTYAASADPADAAAATLADGYYNRWFLDPVFRGSYPPDVLAHFQRAMPVVDAADHADIAQPLDVLGINYYFPRRIRSDRDEAEPLPFHELTTEELMASGRPVTSMGWEIEPAAFTDLLLRVSRDYRPRSIAITENGAAFPDRVVDGRVDDPHRIAYLDGHIRAVDAAAAVGAPMDAYFVWSLMDNFEWTFGFSRRFGIVYVDYETLERIPKASARWCAGLVAAHRSAGPGGR